MSARRSAWFMALLLGAVIALAVPFSPARAADEGDGPRGRGSSGTRRYNGWGALFALPRREFKDLAGNGIGLEAQTSGALDAHGVLRMHSDVSLLYHLRRDHDVPAGQLAPGDQLALGTSASMFHILIGPELSMPSGGRRLYVFGTVGYGTAWVRQELSGHINGGVEAYDLQVSRQSNMFAWSAGGGVRIARGNGAWLDLSAEFRDALGASMITTDQVSTTGPVVSYGQRDVDMGQLIFRLAFARSPGL